MPLQPLIVSLLAAAESAPTDVTLRLHLVELLREHGETTEAIRHCGAAISVDPKNENARALMRELLDAADDERGHRPPARPAALERRGDDGRGAQTGHAPAIENSPDDDEHPADASVRGRADRDDDRDDLWAQRANVTLADIGGMEVAKERLEAAVLAPMRNPELRRLYRQSRSGGVLLYGPPGCGKTFLARATAGELDVRFLSVDFAGLSRDEQVEEIGAVFQAAREQAPVVLCLVGVEHLSDRTTVLGRRAASTRSVTALAAELDKGPEGNLGVTILGTTNAPWGVDPVLRRPGRLEQTLLVLPPDRTTREVVLHQQLGDHPEVDIPEIARRSSGYSGRDLTAAIHDAESHAAPLTTRDVLDALAGREPSARRWLELAARETSAMSEPGAYVGLREYLASRGTTSAAPPA
ncbi:AAA family ATPase [Mobilicoccus massiliensis]|uniref:AAA family ATPase n=1 Tax=Mobilicoccus massiliensis TaxID=1522310 RepID=UPI000694B732|nr:ATP-binding protein [Mobilicoccus massiliensis]